MTLQEFFPKNAVDRFIEPCVTNEANIFLSRLNNITHYLNRSRNVQHLESLKISNLVFISFELNRFAISVTQTGNIVSNKC